MAAVNPLERNLDYTQIFKEAFLAGVVALVLAFPLVGFKTIDVTGGLAIDTRFDWVAIGVAFVFVGRLLIGFYNGVRTPAKEGEGIFAKAGVFINPYVKWLVIAALVFAVIMPLTSMANRYTVDVATAVLIYVMLGWGLNIVVGLAGLLDLGYVAFYAVGAYSYALLATHFDWSFWVCLPLAGVFAAFFWHYSRFPGVEIAR